MEDHVEKKRTTKPTGFEFTLYFESTPNVYYMIIEDYQSKSMMINNNFSEAGSWMQIIALDYFGSANGLT